MKKPFLVLFVTVLAVIFATAAYASDTGAQAQPGSDVVSEHIRQRVSSLLSEKYRGKSESLDSADFRSLDREIKAIIREEYSTAGWREVVNGPQTAQEVLDIVTEGMDPKAVRLAYLDLDTAPEALKDYILSARRSVIYQFSWEADITADTFGYGCDRDPASRTFELAPRFSDLFPGWYEPKLSLELPDWRDAPEWMLSFGGSSVCGLCLHLSGVRFA